MLVRFTRDWHRPKAAEGEELELAEDVALHLIHRGVAEPVKKQAERAVVVTPEKGVLG